MAAFLRSVQDRVKLDLERMQRRAEGKHLPLKRPALVKAATAECKKIKSEAGVKEELVDSGDDEPLQTVKLELEEGGHVAEEELSKAQLVELHCLQVLEKGASRKAHPVHCPACSKTFEGRNRAKVWQHVRGAEHRRNLDAKQRSFQVPDQPESIVEVKPKTVRMKCGGLLLSSEQVHFQGLLNICIYI